ncbi:MAG: hypothetical protein ABGZ35_29020 [Planctomycetaceae bacterium]
MLDASYDETGCYGLPVKTPGDTALLCVLCRTASSEGQSNVCTRREIVPKNVPQMTVAGIRQSFRHN